MELTATEIVYQRSSNPFEMQDFNTEAKKLFKRAESVIIRIFMRRRRKKTALKTGQCS